ncbi:MAG: hypothetical protein DMG04_26730 [Acidobacteria bacterium]|nr:MAG: hypothetical protein DMG04_26730 [Acidobacteriota bacterium]PYQ86648.1 MAG: hypothetical protein DMG02_23380 [Acidobacteriota bacterium]
MKLASNAVRLASVLFLTAIIVAAACGRADKGRTESASAATRAGANGEKYPEPRWPSYFKPPKSIDDLMDAARSFVRNQSGLQGKGMGILQPGDQVLIVANNDADPMVLDAIKRALGERRITPHMKFVYEMAGETREAADARIARREKGHDITKAGIYQASQWIENQFPNPAEPKAWLKARRPDVYKELFPGETGDVTYDPNAPKQRPRGEAAGGAGGPGGEDADTGAATSTDYRSRNAVGEGIKKYLTAHPEVRGVFWGQGGSTGLRRQLYPMSDKFLGTFVTDNVYTLQSQMSTYPGDVWQLAEEQLLEPLVFVDRMEAKDPEGLDVWADITDEMAQRWAAGAYQRGHLYMFPNQATGRFGYSFVNYPAFQQKWLAREPIARVNGTIAGTQGHGGFFPRWEITFTNGFISDVKGGGAQGEALKEFVKWDKLNNMTYPYHNQPGFWYLYEIAFGSHPKAFRHPIPLLKTGNTSPDRVRSGVIHWGLGIRLWHDPDAPTESKVWREFSEKNNVPFDHGWHTHTYFTTYRLRLRNANRWVNVLEKGHMTSLDNPEVRALASRYGDPNYLLTEDWIPEVPGINAPGDYLKDYAPDPGKYSLQLLDKANKGTYEHYFPGAGAKITLGPVAPGKRGNN